MPIIEADASGLEVVGAAVLSEDKMLCSELRDGKDIHEDNREKFGLPTTLVAKVLKFRILYGANEFSFARDPDFADVSTKPEFWKEVIEKYYDKYNGIKKWHDKLMFDVSRSGEYRSPTGRIYEFTPVQKYGKLGLPRTAILNYPVQGFGADLMSIARVSAAKRLQQNFKGEDYKLINTVHDSILVDTRSELVYDVCECLDKVFRDIPENYRRYFNQPFPVPMTSKIKYGPNWKEVTRWKSK